MLKKLFARKVTQAQPEPVVIPRHEHNISRSAISPNALKVLYRLKDAGFSAYLVGGGVRDLLLERAPKDFDIATNAHPEQIKKLFRNCLLIGRRFRLAHIRFGRETIEVATFRSSQTSKKSKHLYSAEHGMLLRDNVYGTLVEDAWRRDFTVNALYYNIADFSVIDYCGGIADLKHRTLRIIGDARERFREDPVRLLRTIRFAGKLGFQIHPDTEAPITELAALLQHVPAARLFDEVLKLFHSGEALTTFQFLRHYHLFTQLFPQTAACLKKTKYATHAEHLLKTACENTDTRIRAHKTVSPAFLFAALLWYPRANLIEQYEAEGLPAQIARDAAEQEVLKQQIQQISIPRRFTQVVREIWGLQQRLQHCHRKHVLNILAHPRFRAGYDFLLLRASAGEALQKIADWWTLFQDTDTETRQMMIEKLPKPRRRKSKSVKSTA